MSKYVVRWNDYHHDDFGTPCTVRHETVLVPAYIGDRPDKCAFASESLSEVMQVNEQLGCMNQTLFSVSDDGTETPLPTYEEALAALQTSRAQAIAEAVTWLRERANATDAEVDDDCDGEDADRFCAEAELLRKAADDMERWNAPAKIERLRSAAESIITIEDVTDSGTEWLVSFDGPNPTADRCVHVANRGEAAKLTMLIASLFDEVSQ